MTRISLWMTRLIVEIEIAPDDKPDEAQLLNLKGSAFKVGILMMLVDTRSSIVV